MWKPLCWLLIWNSTVDCKLIILLSDFSWLEYSGILRKVEARILLLPWAFSLKLHQNLRKNMLFQAHLLIHQRPTRFWVIAVLVKLPLLSIKLFETVTSTKFTSFQRKVNLWHLLLPWAFSFKLSQYLCKNLLFQTYVLIHQRPARFRVIIILVSVTEFAELSHCSTQPWIKSASNYMIIIMISITINITNKNPNSKQM